MTLTQLLKVEDLFDELDDEERQEVDREFEVKDNLELEEIIRDYERALELKLEYPDNLTYCKHKSWYYKRLKKSFRKSYNAKNIELFSLMLPKLQVKDIKDKEDKIGIYLSHIINKSLDNKIIIHVNDSLNYLGYLNTKELIIKGHAGNWIGWNMKSGKIHVYGNVGNGIGFEMRGGKIIVNGDAGCDVGYKMRKGIISVKGNVVWKVGREMKNGMIVVEGNAGWSVGMWMGDGKIIINGDAGNQVGNSMIGGEIHINGDYGNIPHPDFRCNIYHKGQFIYDKKYKK